MRAVIPNTGILCAGGDDQFIERNTAPVAQDFPAREIDAGHFGQDDPDVVDVPKNAANGRGDVGR